MKRKGATDPDDISPAFLKSLGLLVLQELLSIFNASFHLADCPRIWRVAIIIPLLNAAKSPSHVASFQLVSLTPCIIWLLERIIGDWLYYITEFNNLFSRFQAGFSKGRSCKDQILRTDQAIEDGLQQLLLLCLQTMFHPDNCSQKKKTPLQQLSQKSIKFMTGAEHGNLT